MQKPKLTSYLLPLVWVVLALAAFHIFLFGFLVKANISVLDLTINYVLLFVLFITGYTAVFQAAQQNKKSVLKKYVLGAVFRFILGAAFLVASTVSAEKPFLQALHFIIPFLLLTGFTFYGAKKLA